METNSQGGHASSANRGRAGGMGGTHSFWSSSISSLFWHLVVGWAMLNCEGKKKKSTPIRDQTNTHESRRRWGIHQFAAWIKRGGAGAYLHGGGHLEAKGFGREAQPEGWMGELYTGRGSCGVRVERDPTTHICWAAGSLLF